VSSAQILSGDVMDMLKTLPSDSVDCVVTSPPYWGLRDCGVAGQIGLEPTLAEFIAKLVEVFEEVRRVLKPTGTCWVNMGDCYMTGAGKVNTAPGGGTQGERWKGVRGVDKLASLGPKQQPNRMPQAGFKPKDLAGQLWRLAFALQDAGWWLRQDIIWHKPNPMPESIRDRFAKAHEYIFLLTKAERYFWDKAGIAEPVNGGAYARFADNSRGVNFGHGMDSEERGRGRVKYKTPDGWDTRKGEGGHGSFHKNGREAGKIAAAASGVKNNASFAPSIQDLVDTRNPRSVWSMATEPCKEAHFATFPTAIPRRAILAGCPLGGLVLDPFNGSGTTGQVALELGRSYIGIELNPEYVEMTNRRLANVTQGFDFGVAA
jgi:DNA modification methylase